jgi:alpha-mannosidase
MVEAVKKAEDTDDLIIRLYETSGTFAETSVAFGVTGVEIEEVDLMENPLGKAADRLTFQPFEIKSLRVKLG